MIPATLLLISSGNGRSVPRSRAARFIAWLGVAASKFQNWKTRYGLANEHNALVPRDWWLEPWEKAAIIDFHGRHPLEGYGRLAFMMLDSNVLAVSPSSVYRVLGDAGLMKRINSKPSLKGRGFSSRSPLTITGTTCAKHVCLYRVVNVRSGSSMLVPIDVRKKSRFGADSPFQAIRNDYLSSYVHLPEALSPRFRVHPVN